MGDFVGLQTQGAVGVIRLDRAIIPGLEHHPARRALVRLMVGYAAE